MSLEWMDEIDNTHIEVAVQQFEHLFDRVRSHAKDDLCAGFVTMLLWNSEMDRRRVEYDGEIEDAI